MNKTFSQTGLQTARLVIVLTGSFAAADARELHTGIGVSATVAAMARMELQSTPDAIRLTAGDVQRGYVDVLQPTSFTVRSNSPHGFALDLTTVAPLLTSMIVQGLGEDVVLGADGGTLVQRWQNQHVATVSLTFRFVLVPGLTPGQYPWPMRAAVRPLNSI